MAFTSNPFHTHTQHAPATKYFYTHARVHGGFVSAVHFGAVQGLARERVVRGGEVRGAQKALVGVHATKRRVVLGETSSDCRGAQVALRARHAPLTGHKLRCRWRS